MTCQVCGTSVFKGCDCSKPVSKIEPVFEIGFGWRYGEPLKNGTLLFTEAQLQQAVAEAKASVLGKTPMDIIDEHVAEATAFLNHKVKCLEMERRSQDSALAAKDAEINELSESIGFRNQELNQKDAEIAELKTKLNQKER